MTRELHLNVSHVCRKEVTSVQRLICLPLLQENLNLVVLLNNQFQKQPAEVFFKKAILKNFATFTGKHLCWRLFLINLQTWRPTSLLKRDSNTVVFPMNVTKFLKTPILKNLCKRLLVPFQKIGGDDLL